MTSFNVIIDYFNGKFRPFYRQVYILGNKFISNKGKFFCHGSSSREHYVRGQQMHYFFFFFTKAKFIKVQSSIAPQPPYSITSEQ